VTPSTSADFCDTNVLAYAHDESETVKRVRAAALYEKLWAGATGVVSVQVLQELYVTLTRKVHPPVNHEAARATIDDLLSWRVFEPAKQDVLAPLTARYDAVAAGRGVCCLRGHFDASRRAPWPILPAAVSIGGVSLRPTVIRLVIELDWDARRVALWSS